MRPSIVAASCLALPSLAGIHAYVLPSAPGSIRQASCDSCDRRHSGTALWGRRKRALDEELDGTASSGKWTKVSGITLPEQGKMKAWELDLGGKQLRLAAIEHDGRYFALEGACPRCAFDLWKGKIVTAEAAEGGPAPARVACPVCSTTYELATGTAGEPIKEKGFNGWLGGLAQAATATNAVGRVKTIPVRAGVGGEGGVQLDFTKFK